MSQFYDKEKIYNIEDSKLLFSFYRDYYWMTGPWYTRNDVYRTKRGNYFIAEYEYNISFFGKVKYINDKPRMYTTDKKDIIEVIIKYNKDLNKILIEAPDLKKLVKYA